MTVSSYTMIPITKPMSGTEAAEAVKAAAQDSASPALQGPAISEAEMQ